MRLMTRRKDAIALASTLSVVLASCGGPSSSTTPAPLTGTLTSQTASIPLVLNPGDPTPLIHVSIGGGPQLTLILDTGSSGMRVFSNALNGANYADTGTASQITFGSRGNDRLYTGDVGVTSDVAIGGIDIGGGLTGKIAFQIVSKVYPCGSTACTPESGTFPNEMTALGGAQGVFGIEPVVYLDSTGSAQPVHSLMSEIPGAFASGFIVSLENALGPRLVGLTSATTGGFQIHPVSEVETTTDGSIYWPTDRFTWCYSFGSSFTNQCLSGVLDDTGGQSTHLYFPSATPVPPGATTPGMLAPLPGGTSITATIPQNGLGGTADITWQTTAGASCVSSAIDVAYGAPPTGTSSNGVDPFYQNDVLYDLADGKFGFRAVTQTPTVIC